MCSSCGIEKPCKRSCVCRCHGLGKRRFLFFKRHFPDFVPITSDQHNFTNHITELQNDFA